MKSKKIYLFITAFIASIIVLSSINTQIFSKIDLVQYNTNQEIFQSKLTSYTENWLKNENFTTTPIEPTWFLTSSGDTSDVYAMEGTGCADLRVIGEENTFSIVSDPPSSSNWTKALNPDFPVYPKNGSGIDSHGCWATHVWNEIGGDETGQTPSVHWKRNVSMPVNMSDYEITGASVSTTVNATVLQDIDCPGDAHTGGSNNNSNGDVWDYVRFYVLISDLPGVKEYEIAYNKTTYLGAGDKTSSPSTMGETYLITIPEDSLIFYLSNILETDDYNFTITLGMFIYCEDNDQGYELDTWSMLRIKSFNLTMTYEKKIDRGTNIAWNQIGNALPDPPINGSVSVDEALLFFKYKIDQNWTSNSPNSEIRILINNKQHSETIKLSNAKNTFQEGKLVGFDLTSLISTTENITLSIQLYLADNFILDSNTTISIDDVVLIITYTIFEPDPSPPAPFNWWLIILPLVFGLIALGSIFAAYQYHFKIPRIIRIIRKLKKNIKTNNVSTDALDLNSRTNITTTISKKQVKSLDFEIKKTTGESK